MAIFVKTSPPEMKPHIILTLTAFLSALLASGQYQNALVGNNYYPNEPAIVVSPKDPNILVAGANTDIFSIISSDGGLTWEEGFLTSQYGVWGDPCIIADTAGDFYYFHLSNPPGGNWIDRIVCQKSTDNGATWSDGTFMGLNGAKAQDKEWAVVDPATNNIYVTWSQFDNYGSPDPADSSLIMFSRSTDGCADLEPGCQDQQGGGRLHRQRQYR